MAKKELSKEVKFGMGLLAALFVTLSIAHFNEEKKEKEKISQEKNNATLAVAGVIGLIILLAKYSKP